jgi:ABC-type cobalamin/Fe3+-siderophores transport system ATPase subunit
MMIRVENLCVAYGARAVLEDINFELEEGQVLAVIGPNGAGKSTLIKAMSGVLPVRSGRITYQGQPIDRLPPEARARLMAVVPQAIHIPPAFSVEETVLLGRTPYLNWLGQLSAHDRQAARQAMQRTHTLDLAQRPIGELSGGEQQRILLARALAQAAPVLLMDEPTTHLDLKYQISLLDYVHSLVERDGKSVLIAMHDLNLVARFADKIALLANGRLRALGSAVEVLQADLLSEVYQIPLQVVEVERVQTPLVLPVNHSGRHSQPKQE